MSKSNIGIVTQFVDKNYKPLSIGDRIHICDDNGAEYTALISSEGGATIDMDSVVSIKEPNDWNHSHSWIETTYFKRRWRREFAPVIITLSSIPYYDSEPAKPKTFFWDSVPVIPCDCVKINTVFDKKETSTS